MFDTILKVALQTNDRRAAAELLLVTRRIASFRAVVLAAFLFASGASGVLAAKGPERPHQRGASEGQVVVAPHGDWAAIVSAILETQDFGDPPPPPPPPPPGQTALSRTPPQRVVVLIDSSDTLCVERRASCTEDYGANVLSFSDDEIPADVRRALVAANQVSVELPAGIGRAEQTPRAAVERLIKTDAWDTFRARYPDGVISVSRAVLSPDQDSAWIYVNHTLGGFGGSGQVMLLSRSGSGWLVARRWLTWIS